MDILPTITNLIFYATAALIFVLLISLLFRSLTHKNRTKEDEAIIVHREKVRTYLRNHPYYSSARKSEYEKYTRTPIYSVPTYSEQIRRSNSTKSKVDLRNISGKHTRTSDEKQNDRYFILNGGNRNKAVEFENHRSTQIFTSLRSNHHYKS